MELDVGYSSGAIVIPTADRAREIRSRTLVGSDPTLAELVIDDPSVSPRHALLVPDGIDDTWRVYDLGSHHGTFVDGARIDAECRLSGRHELQLGRARLSFVIEPVARIIEDGSACWIERRDRTVQLDDADLGILRVLVRARLTEVERPPASRGFVQSTVLEQQLATATIRQLLRRLERKLGALGEPPLVEFCERRGFRVRDCVFLGRSPAPR